MLWRGQPLRGLYPLTSPCAPVLISIYVFVKDASNGEVYCLAQARLETYYKNEDDYELLKTVKGSELKGWSYEPLFPYFAERANCFQI